MDTTLLQILLNGIVLAMSASAFYSLRAGGKLLGLIKVPPEPLTESEQLRLDNLLASAKRYHHTSVFLSAVLLAGSSLETFEKFAAPFGGIQFPKLQTAIGIFLLVIALLMVTDRFFLMAYPWLTLDRRRPPYDWIVMGLVFERKYPVGIWLNLPLVVSSIALTILLRDEASVPDGVTLLTFLMCGLGFVYLPRSVYYWIHLITERVDHRGGAATLSMCLLYQYRVIRQILFSVFIAYPVVAIIPRWRNPQLRTAVAIVASALIVLFFVRAIAGMRSVYRRIDRLGPRFGFPATSQHYD